MTLELRPYQQQAVDKTLFEWLPNNDGGALIIMPTGTGKSIVIAKIIDYVNQYPNQRIIVATFSQELVEQDYLELVGLCPFLNVGILCAGLGERNTTAPILFVSIKSAYDKAFKIGRCDMLIIDEAQCISRDQDTMWGQFIHDLKIVTPTMRIVGTTATGYRMESGSLIGGKNAMFHGIAYEYPLLEAIQDGYLCELITPKMDTKYNVSQVGLSGGDFKPGELQKAVDIDEITKAAVAELMQFRTTRHCWIVFAAGVDHAENIAAEIRSYGMTAEAITIRTPKAKRKKIIEQHKSGEITVLVSMIILTVGYNNKRVDLIADMCPTKSKGRHVQKNGRGTRPLYAKGYDLKTREGRLAGIANGPKPNCVVCDFARNSARFGPLDQIKGDENREKGSGDAPVKVCPNKKCGCVMFAGAMECPDCGYVFPDKPPELDTKADDSPMLSTQVVPEWHTVISTRYSRLLGKNGKQDWLCANYTTDSGDIFKELVGIEHSYAARERAALWHRRRLPNHPLPNTIDEALLLPYPSAEQVCVRKNGKYFEVINVKLVDLSIEKTLDKSAPLYEPEKNWEPITEIPMF